MIDTAFDELLSVRPGDDYAPFKVAKIATCLGKTRSAIRRAVAAAVTGTKIIYLCPTHQLGAELAGRIQDEARRQ
ncbi:MAG TPA: hypothetical protein VEQ64_14280, partial [Xanthobacteraceae bacterium]|nr:hypothetical protein [Xanthobacteraceae bacterium]